MSKRLNKADRIKADQLARELIEAAQEKYVARKIAKGNYDPDSNEPCPMITSDDVLGGIEMIAHVLVERGVV